MVVVCGGFDGRLRTANVERASLPAVVLYLPGLAKKAAGRCPPEVRRHDVMLRGAVGDFLATLAPSFVGSSVIADEV